MTKTMLSLLVETAERFPEHAAFEDEACILSWRELLARSRQIGTALSHLLPKHSPVAVCMEKKPETIAAMLGVLWAGCYYTIIDCTMPEKRISMILDVFAPYAVLCEEGETNKWQRLAQNVYCLSAKQLTEDEDDARLECIQRELVDTDLMYVLFTSGSTGVPKGVSIRHASVINFSAWAVETLHINEQCRFGNQAPLYFDNSVLEICCAIRTGATVHFIPRKCFMFAGKLISYLEDYGIDTLFWVPSALMAPANAGVIKDGRPKGVKRVFFCGEVMPCKQLNIWRASLPNADYVNMYGPTEITDVCAWYRVKRDFRDEDALPIGFPCDNTRILLLDGEICVAGSCLAAGYYRSPDKTAEAFVQNPLNLTLRELIYKTGDLGAYNDRGELMFLGRKDSQVKRQGYRIELGEIEVALKTCNGVDNGCCFYDAAKETITAVYTGRLSERDVKAALKLMLPKYMLPDEYRMMPMPLTGNGKIDRQRLMRELK
jgi:amino acid adenylation domain-containing protein